MSKIDSRSGLLEREQEVMKILNLFLDKKLDFVVVGGYAISTYKKRFSIDLDIIVKEENLKEFQKALEKEGYVLHYEKEIALKQGIKELTVWGHLIKLIEYKQLSVWQILPRNKIYKILKKIYSHKERLRDIKKRFKDDEITYDDIACVMASIKSKRRWKKNKKCPVTK